MRRFVYACSAFAALIAVSCVHPRSNGGPGVDVTVSAFSEPMSHLSRATPICFKTTLGKHEPLEKRSRLFDIADICTRVARAKGLEIVPLDANPNCLMAEFGWEAGDGTSHYLGTSSSCQATYGHLVCSSHERRVTLYGKGLQIVFYDRSNAASEKIHEIRAGVVTENRGFLDGTAAALCRAAFADFPRRMVEELYFAGTDVPDDDQTEVPIR